MRNLLKWLYRVEDGLLVALLLAMIVLAGVDILARLALGSGMTWIAPVLRVLVLWIGLLGALVATRSREHIAIDVLSRFAPVPVRTIMHFVAAAFAAFICLVLAYYSKNYVQTAYEFGDKAFADVPAWLLQLIIPVTFGLMGLRFMVQAVQALRPSSQKVVA